MSNRSRCLHLPASLVLVVCIILAAQGQSATAACPSGYQLRTGDVAGLGNSAAFGAEASTSPIASADACAARCSARPTCLSFEYSPTTKICSLNTAAAPDVGSSNYQDYLFCSKSEAASGGQCPAGFRQMVGDVAGSGSSTFGTEASEVFIATAQACGARCLALENCRSFEWSPTEKRCNLNTAATPDLGSANYLDYVFCSKIGQPSVIAVCGDGICSSTESCSKNYYNQRNSAVDNSPGVCIPDCGYCPNALVVDSGVVDIGTGSRTVTVKFNVKFAAAPYVMFSGPKYFDSNSGFWRVIVKSVTATEVVFESSGIAFALSGWWIAVPRNVPGIWMMNMRPEQTDTERAGLMVRPGSFTWASSGAADASARFVNRSVPAPIYFRSVAGGSSQDLAATNGVYNTFWSLNYMGYDRNPYFRYVTRTLVSPALQLSPVASLRLDTWADTSIGEFGVDVLVWDDATWGRCFQTGDVFLGGHGDNTGTGSREETVQFPTAFAETPRVVLSRINLDERGGWRAFGERGASSARRALDVKSVSLTRMIISSSTWSDSKIAATGVRWLATGNMVETRTLGMEFRGLDEVMRAVQKGENAQVDYVASMTLTNSGNSAVTGTMALEYRKAWVNTVTTSETSEHRGDFGLSFTGEKGQEIPGAVSWKVSATASIAFGYTKSESRENSITEEQSITNTQTITLTGGTEQTCVKAYAYSYVRRNVKIPITITQEFQFTCQSGSSRLNILEYLATNHGFTVTGNRRVKWIDPSGSRAVVEIDASLTASYGAFGSLAICPCTSPSFDASETSCFGLSQKPLESGLLTAKRANN